MIYFGSGAEFDKTSAIIDIKEEAFGRSIPKDQYGLGKYIMNLNTRTSNNIYNLRLFGTINPLERYTKMLLVIFASKRYRVTRYPCVKIVCSALLIWMMLFCWLSECFGKIYVFMITI